MNQPNTDLNLAAEAPEARERSLDIVAGVVELAGDLGAPYVQVGPGKVNPLFASPREKTIQRFFRSLDVLVPLAERVGTGILVENMPFSFLPDAAGLVAALDDYGSDDIGMTYDLANGFFIGEDAREGLQLVQPRLRVVHASDTGAAVYRHDPIGMGEIDFGDAREALRSIDWNGRPVLEIVSRSEDPWTIIAESADALDRAGWAGISTL